VSYILLSYNQQEYIAEAVNSAIEQTYKPLEIIISDDCSTDSTFEVIKKTCSGYKGSNKLILNQNEANYGLVSHFNKLIEISNGQFIVLAAGDDVSTTERAKTLTSAWHKNKCYVIGCNPIVIDEENKVLGKFYRSNEGAIDFSWQAMIRRENVGLFITAIDRQVFDKWGPIDTCLPMEDQSIPFRAALMKENSVLFIDEPLVKYRCHSKSMVEELRFGSGINSIKDIFVCKIRSRYLNQKSWHEDLEKSEFAHIGEQDKRHYLNLLHRRIVRYKLIEQLVVSSGFKQRKKIMLEVINSGTTKIIEFISLLPFLLAPNFSIKVISIVAIIANMGKRRGV